MSLRWREAQKHLVGGVDSPVRAFKSVGGEPVFVAQALGPYLFDEDGKRYLDLCMSWGAILLGHANERVVRDVAARAMKGTSFGAATTLEVELAKSIKKYFPRLEKIRFTSSGTEAAMSAIRLARGCTGRKRIVKFDGCYHGHSDGLLVKAGSGLKTFGTPTSAGVPEEIAELTAVLPYNDAEAVKRYFRDERDTACVIVEPVAGNMGVVPGDRKFLETLRSETRKAGALLIFDEVISGFRACAGGAQHVYGIDPDITVLGKIIGGGLPVGAFGASARIMDRLSPLGDVYQAGTLSGNPLSMTAGLAVLSQLSPALYKELDAKTAWFTAELKKTLAGRGQKVTINRSASMFTVFFGDDKMNGFRKYFRLLLENGVYVPPSAFEASFLCREHTQAGLEKALEVLKKW